MKGQVIDTMSFLALGSFGLYYGLFSYNGTVIFMMSADVETVAVINKHWKYEFEALFEVPRVLDICKESQLFMCSLKMLQRLVD